MNDDGRAVGPRISEFVIDQLTNSIADGFTRKFMRLQITRSAGGDGDAVDEFENSRLKTLRFDAPRADLIALPS